MTERDLFIKNIPKIAEMVLECRRMDRQEYEDWKQRVMEHASGEAEGFMGKVLSSIDSAVINDRAVINT